MCPPFMQRFTLHSHHLNKDPALTSWENQLVISTTSEVTTTEALVLFVCYNDIDCGVIKMPYMIRLVRKSDNQAALGLHECTDIAYTASPGQRVAAYWGQADTSVWGENPQLLKHLHRHLATSGRTLLSEHDKLHWELMAQVLLYFCCLRQQTASCLLLVAI